jgi:hypothetical protein
MNVWWCLQWDSVVYTATPPPPPHNGPPPPGGRGGPACRGQGAPAPNSKIFFIHWRTQILRSMDEHSNIAQTQISNANIGLWDGFPADWELSCFSCHRYRHHWRTYWLTLELIDLKNSSALVIRHYHRINLKNLPYNWKLHENWIYNFRRVVGTLKRQSIGTYNLRVASPHELKWQ